MDVSVQAQVINLLEDLKHDFQLTYLFIAHDLAVVKHICDRISVMYLGKIVETAETDELFRNPLHPYTQGLLSSIPIPNPHMRKIGKRELVKGDIPSPVDPPDNCRFVKRCPKAFDRCSKEAPRLTETGSGHYVSCFRTADLVMQRDQSKTKIQRKDSRRAQDRRGGTRSSRRESIFLSLPA